MIVKNTKNNRELKRVSATMAIENMFVDKNFMKEILKVSTGSKTHEELRQEILKKHTR